MPRSTEPDSDPRDLLPRVRAYIAEQHMLVPAESVVVGVSGGPDSVALLDLLFRLRGELQIALCVAHLHHGLRGADAEGDAAFVADLAAARGLPCHGGTADVEALARRGKYAPEEAGRIARHSFLEDTRRKTGSARIALGHTRSDQAETLLLRLLRGAGRRGLGAIRPVRDQIWIRPLLQVSRSEIQAYISFRRLETRQDRTNTHPRFLRNRIRHDLLPRLAAEYTPGIEQVLARTSEILQCEDDLLNQQAEAALQKVVQYRGKQKIILDVRSVFGYHVSLQRRIVQKVLFCYGAGADAFGFQTVQSILKLLSHRSGTVQISPEVSAHKSGHRLIFCRATPPFHVRVRVPGHTELPLLDATVETRVRPVEEVRDRLRDLGPCRACFDTKALQGELVLRNRCPGDRFWPYGMSGTRKVSDVLIDGKVPEPLRDEVPLLLSNSTILWVVGLRTAQSAAVTGQTVEVLEIVFRGGWLCTAESSSG